MASSSSSTRSRRGGATSAGAALPPIPPPPPSNIDLDDVNMPPDWIEEEEDWDQLFETVQQEEQRRRRQQQPSEGTPARTTSASSQLKSEIFTVHYNKVKIDGELKAVCKYCEKIYAFKAGGGYGTLNKHLRSKHADKIGMDRGQTQLRGFSGSSQGTDSPLFLYNDLTHRKELAKFVCVKQLPFNFADDEFYENFTQISLNPACRRISRSTLVRDIAKMVGEFKYILVNDFVQLLHKVSICSDVWGDHWQQHHYMGITCHWIDNTWVMQKRLIAYREFDVDHTAANISQKIHTILEEYSLVNKVFSISFDNASANNASLEALINICQPSMGGKFFHIRCICHILNLCVQDGLEDFKTHVAPIRHAIAYLTRHTSLTKKWSKYCKNNNMPPKRFSRDVPNRWNSTYRLLHDSFAYKDLLCSFFAQNECGIVLFSNQWNVCTNLCEVLKVFKEATEELSGVYYPTSCLVIDHCVKIAITFNSFGRSPVLGSCIAKMKEKWLKYFTNIPDVFLVAKLLDPRVRDGLEELLTLYYDNLFPIKDDDTPIPHVIFSRARQHLLDLFKEYRINYGDGGDSSCDQDVTPSPSGTSSDFSMNPNFEALYRFYDTRTQKRSRGYGSSSNPYVEIENYLSTTFEFVSASGEEFDLLKWWRSRQATFPIVSLIAKEILACPASTVAVEQAFSVGGYILDERRSRLTVENLENQALLDDWTKAATRQQNVFQKDEDEEFDTESTTTGTGTGSD